MSVERTALLVLLALLGSACSPDFDEVWQIKDLRILAIQADPPEVLTSASETAPPPVTVTALVVDPALSAAETVGWELWACTAEALTCDEAAQRLLVRRDRTPIDRVRVEGLVLPRDLLLAAVQQDSLRGFGGSVPVKVHLKVQSASGSAEGIKRLVFGVHEWPTKVPPAAGTLGGPCSTTSPACAEGLSCDGASVCRRLPNRNPTITAVKADDQPVLDPLPVTAGEELTLLPQIAEGDKETYWTFTFDGGTLQLGEHLSYAYFVTSGDLSDATTGGKPSAFVENKKIDDISSDWTPDAASPDARLWIVVHDDRGGVSWTSFGATVAPAAAGGS